MGVLLIFVAIFICLDALAILLGLDGMHRWLVGRDLKSIVKLSQRNANGRKAVSQSGNAVYQRWETRPAKHSTRLSRPWDSQTVTAMSGETYWFSGVSWELTSRSFLNISRTQAPQ